MYKFGIIWVKEGMPYIWLSKTEGNLIICGLHRHILYMSASKEILEMLLFNIALIVTSLFKDLMLLIFPLVVA